MVEVMGSNRSGMGSPSGEDVARVLRRPLTNVLVATDLSSGSEPAVARAVQLPCVAGAKLAFLHVVPEDPTAPAALAEEALLAHQLEEARRVAASVDIVPSITKGKPSTEIVRAARDQKSDLIVLGRHGKAAVRATRLGSTAEGVIRNAGTSVLVVSQPVSGPYRQTIVAVDFSKTSRLALELALRLTDATSSTIDVVHAHGAPDEDLPIGFVARDYEQEARTQLEGFLAAAAGAGVEWTTVIERGDPHEVIIDAAAARGCDLIVVGARGHSSLDRFLIVSVAEAVVRAARCDVLVVQSAEDPTP